MNDQKSTDSSVVLTEERKYTIGYRILLGQVMSLSFALKEAPGKLHSHTNEFAGARYLGTDEEIREVAIEVLCDASRLAFTTTGANDIPLSRKKLGYKFLLYIIANQDRQLINLNRDVPRIISELKGNGLNVSFDEMICFTAIAFSDAVYFVLQNGKDKLESTSSAKSASGS